MTFCSTITASSESRIGRIRVLSCGILPDSSGDFTPNIPLEPDWIVIYDDLMRVCGIDEAGRGPIAGPVTAGAVILPELSFGGRAAGALFAALGDSKSLTPDERTRAAALIKEQALAWAVGWSWPDEIDSLNIHRATLLAMNRALSGIYPLPDFVFVDGLFVPDCRLKAKAVVRGDQKIQAVMAASILAKTERDLWMVAYAKMDPRYGFEFHKGYPTHAHRTRIKRYGLSAIHRRSFKISFPE